MLVAANICLQSMTCSASFTLLHAGALRHRGPLIAVAAAYVGQRPAGATVMSMKHVILKCQVGQKVQVWHLPACKLAPDEAPICTPKPIECKARRTGAGPHADDHRVLCMCRVHPAGAPGGPSGSMHVLNA